MELDVSTQIRKSEIAANFPPLFINGSLGINQNNMKSLIKSLQWQTIKLLPIEPKDNSNGVKIIIPIMHPKIESINLNWYHEETQEKAVHVLRNQKDFLSKPGDPQIEANIYFHKEHSPGNMKLNALYFSLTGDEKNAPGNYNFTRPNSVDLSFPIKGFGIQKTDVDINQMKIEALNGGNSLDGNWSINLKIPILNRQANSKFQVYLWIKKPGGKRLHFLISENSLKLNLGKIISENDRDLLIYPLPLPPHPEKGIYLIESIETKTTPDPNFTINNLDYVNFSVKNKLLERGIRKEFTIMPDESVKISPAY